jgi:hypothetical protein
MQEFHLIMEHLDQHLEDGFLVVVVVVVLLDPHQH